MYTLQTRYHGGPVSGRVRYQQLVDVEEYDVIGAIQTPLEEVIGAIKTSQSQVTVDGTMTLRNAHCVLNSNENQCKLNFVCTMLAQGSVYIILLEGPVYLMLLHESIYLILLRGLYI